MWVSDICYLYKVYYMKDIYEKDNDKNLFFLHNFFYLLPNNSHLQDSLLLISSIKVIKLYIKNKSIFWFFIINGHRF